ncbi:hypothetical protein ACUSIJ_28875 [Pseudochelatococcus sp. B33]
MTDLAAGNAVTERARPKSAKIWERDKLNWYVEDEDCTAALLTVEKFHGLTLDPACGQGNIVKTMIAHGYDADGSDIVRRVDADWFVGEIDFLADGAFKPGHCDNLITNPPFFGGKGTEAFIRKALTIATNKVAVFVDLKFLGSDGRASGLYAEHPPSRIYILTPRPSCPPGEYLARGGKASGGTADWCWLVWDLQSPYAGTTFHWLRRAA